MSAGIVYLIKKGTALQNNIFHFSNAKERMYSRRRHNKVAFGNSDRIFPQMTKSRGLRSRAVRYLIVRVHVRESKREGDCDFSVNDIVQCSLVGE